MAADPIIYCLEQLTDYAQFERLCHDLMARQGYVGIEPLGGFRDKGRDAVHVCASSGITTVFAYSVREDWRRKLEDDAKNIRKQGHKCDVMVFATTENPTSSERDKAIERIRQEFGWQLELHGLERMRILLLSPGGVDLLRKHPQIFTPSLFPSIGDLRVHVSPTRQGWRQMAQIQLFNRGTSPIFVTGWYAEWGPDDKGDAIRSGECFQGSLPIRILNQDTHELLIWLDQHPVEHLHRLGVMDGDNQLWLADDQNIKNFIHTAVTHRPPPRPVQDQPDISDLPVEIAVRRYSRSDGLPDRLDVTFRNNGHLPIPVVGARIEWDYNPHRESPRIPGKPHVAEVSGSVRLATESPSVPVEPGAELHFFLPDEMSNVLVAVLAEDVADDDIAIVVWTSSKAAWSAVKEEVPIEIRAVARSIVASWKD